MKSVVKHIGSLALALSVIAGCNKPLQQASAPPKPPEVLVTLPTTAQITDYEDFTGRTVAVKTIDIRARVTGYLDRINFKENEGGDVERDAILFKIDPRSYEAEVARNEAHVLQAQSHLKRLELDLERANKLIGSKSISREQYDQVAGDRKEGESAVATAMADLKLAKLNLSFTEVRAPISGHVSRTQIDPGNLVRADETILTTIVSTNPIYAYFEVDERTLLKMRRYAEEGTTDKKDPGAVPVMMGLADEEGFPHTGTISFVDNRLDPATGTLQVRGSFKNSDRMLSPGLFVRVRLPIGTPYQAVLISEQALGTDQGQKFVYVVDQENKAQYRRVQVGKLQDGQRVVLKGLAEGERVVLSGLQKVRPGAPVQPKMDTATAQLPTGEVSEMAESAVVKELSHK